MTTSQPTATAEAQEVLVDAVFKCYTETTESEDATIGVKLLKGDTCYTVTITQPDGTSMTAVVPNYQSGPWFALSVASAAHHAG